ncbi:MAG: hypothetical protein LRY76_08245 [Alphaproteobacteria bacterium]|nr:hypothetical protein [Alphaproteobacteria bacterium]
MSEQIDEATAGARALLEGLIDHYADPAATYPVQPDPARLPRFNDYEHLSRLKEWGSGDEADNANESGEA